MEITIRKLSPEDAPDYRKIRLESLIAHPDSFGANYEEQNKLPKLMFEKAIESPRDDRFVMGAFDQSALIGICGFIPFAMADFHDLANTGSIIQMYVRPSYRGNNIGTNLIKAVLAEAFKFPDIEQVVLGVKGGNLSAIRVYEKVGFQSYKPDKAEQIYDSNDDKMMIIYLGDYYVD